MADAERDRLDLTFRIERLEMDKQELEASNAAKIEENRNLLDQLENLNNNVIESDTKIRSLEASLLSSMQTVRRLESSAARAADAERHLLMLEEEQEKLHRELRVTREDARTHSQRFKEAQRGIVDMQDQLERMETEARQERERHDEVMRRMERQREVDKQLDIAAGRLKGAAASKNLQTENNKAGNKVINHFVRDLLQDNATLQLGIAELREMLMNSNDEIQSLRDQLDCHQPMEEDLNSPASTLKAELEPHLEPASTGPNLSQELHIHHHYHVTPSKDVKRPKKKRQGLLPGVFTPPLTGSTASSPRSTGQWGIPSSPTAPALLSHDNIDTTPTLSKPGHNWSDFPNPPSDFSSLPGSPRQRGASSVFDQSYADSSDPVTSPTTSFDPMSPTWRASHAKRPSVASSRSFQSLSLLDSEPDLPPHHKLSQSRSGSVIIEEDEDGHSIADTESIIREPASDPPTDDGEMSMDSYPSPHGRLRRTASHESIMSLSGGLDIHTLQMRPSQLTLRPLGGADAVITGVIAQPTLSRVTSKRSDAALRDNFIGFKSPRTVSSPLSQGQAAHSPQTGSKLRGWVGWRPWGGSASSPPTQQAKSQPKATGADDASNESISDTVSEQPSEEPAQPVEEAAAAEQTALAESEPVPTEPAQGTATPKAKDKLQDLAWGRSPGINQPGAVPGFQQYWLSQKRKGAPAKVTAEVVDRDALTEGLEA